MCTYLPYSILLWAVEAFFTTLLRLRIIVGLSPGLGVLVEAGASGTLELPSPSPCGRWCRVS